MNLLATCVIVCNTTFPGRGPLSFADLLQMMGKAGREEHIGRAVAMVRDRMMPVMRKNSRKIVEE